MLQNLFNVAAQCVAHLLRAGEAPCINVGHKTTILAAVLYMGYGKESGDF
jgi:hypothetical protein